MKNLYLIIFMFTLLLYSCSNNVLDKSISEKLTTEELSKIMKNDALFSKFYETIRKNYDKLSDTKQAEFYDITYNRLYDFVKFMQDSTYWIPLCEKWENDWENEYGFYLIKGDSVLNYWKEYVSKRDISIGSDEVPLIVMGCLSMERAKNTVGFIFYRDQLIMEILNENYIGKLKYLQKKSKDIFGKKDNVCFSFFEKSVDWEDYPYYFGNNYYYIYGD